MKNTSPIVTLTTDFGSSDGLVGALKGILLQGCPEAQLVDICHNVPAQDVVTAALVLEQAAPHFPHGTVHLVVVDPGVGTSRKALVMVTPVASFVGPDNGVLELVWRAAEENFGLNNLQAYEIKEKRFFRPNPSPTFHGRDIFAPVAAALARGTDPREVGPPAKRIETLGLPEAEPMSGGGLRGEVIAFDSFGNAITNLTRSEIEQIGPLDRSEVFLVERCVGCLRHTFADVRAGELLAYIGSSGRLELALRNANLRQDCCVSRGDAVRVQPR